MDPPVERRLVFPDDADDGGGVAADTRHPGESYVFCRLSLQSLAGLSRGPGPGADGDGGRAPPRKLMVKCGKRWGSGSEILRHEADCLGCCSGSAIGAQGHARAGAKQASGALAIAK